MIIRPLIFALAIATSPVCQAQDIDPPHAVKMEQAEEAPASLIMVAFTANPEGVPTNISVVSTTDPDLNDMAVEIVSKWRLKPTGKMQKIRAPISFDKEMIRKIKAEKTRQATESAMQKAPSDTQEEAPAKSADR